MIAEVISSMRSRAAQVREDAACQVKQGKIEEGAKLRCMADGMDEAADRLAVVQPSTLEDLAELVTGLRAEKVRMLVTATGFTRSGMVAAGARMRRKADGFNAVIVRCERVFAEQEVARA